MPAKLTAQDWDFRALWPRRKLKHDRGSNAELIAACWYEYARESRLIRIAMWRWLRLEKPRAELYQRAEERNIELKDLRRALLYYWQGVCWERHRLGLEPGYKPDWPEDLRESVERDNPAAEKLLAGLSDKYPELVRSEYLVELIESCGGKAAPRPRFLANYLVKDTPWFLIPKEDRDDAIATALKGDDTDFFFFFRTLPPVEREDEWQELVRRREALPGIGPGEDDARVRWGLFTDKQISRSAKNHRPEKYKRKAKDSGRGRSDLWSAALKELSAMRLMHFLPPKDALGSFFEVYSHGIEESNLRRLRRNSIKTFQRLFDTDEEPRHMKTFVQRKRRG